MKNFGIRELIPCIDGHCRDQRCGYDESTIVRVPSEVIQNAIALVEEVLDPLREQYGHPIYVNSGYRCPVKNKAIGGAANSQHCKGQAADITAGSPDENLKLLRILIKMNHFDQVIIYVHPGSFKPQFIHVTWKRNGANRRTILKKVIGSAPVYPRLTPEELSAIVKQ